MSRYDIAIKKPPERESTLKKFFQSARDKLTQGATGVSQKTSSAACTLRDLPDGGLRVQGETGFAGIVQGETGFQGDTGLTFRRAGISGALRLEPGGRIGIGCPPIPRGLDVVGSGSGSGLNIVASTGNGVEVRVPISQFLSITGPNGYRLLLPIRALQHSMIRETDYNRVSFTIRLSSNEANSLQSDITAGKERLGL